MELFHFDIECAGTYKDFNSFRLADKQGSTLFENKYDKLWKDKYESVNDAYLENSSIIPTYGKICCISFGYLDNSTKRISSYYSDDEKYIVESFNNLLKKIEQKKFNLCGFRIAYFDIPWILHKLHKYNIKPADIINPYSKKPWDMRITDLSDDWKQKFAWSFSFDEMCYELGIKSPKDKMNGSQVHSYYWSNRIGEIREYCEKDVSSSIDASIILYS